jgi:lipid-A-disaccharide synthase
MKAYYEGPALPSHLEHQIKTSPRIAVVAGEASGDLLASLLIKGILQRWPDAEIFGIGGEAMCALGFKALWPSHKLSVRGYFEVLMHFREILGIRNQLKKELLLNPPDLFIGVDAPDFNLALERTLKEAKIATLHFVCPSIWAWRASRAITLGQSADHVLCIFPFEPSILERYRIKATFVGHPLAQIIPMQVDAKSARMQLGLSLDSRVVTLMPGSRASEVEHMTERFLRAALIMQETDPSLHFLLPVVPHLVEWVEALCKRITVPNLKILHSQSHTALAACDVVLVASGTATLEAALYKRPMVIGYHVNWFSYLLIWPQRLLPWIGLPNILLNKEVVPELLQTKATPKAMAKEILNLLNSPSDVLTLKATFSELHHQLIRDTPTIATEVIAGFIAN